MIAKTILFRGGMVGDLLLNMLDSECMITVNGKTKLNPEQVAMKKFTNFNTQEKLDYYKNIENKYRYVLSHDTDFCYNHSIDLIQIVCTDHQKLNLFSERFVAIHVNEESVAVDNAKQYINSSDDNFVDDYTSSIMDWQNYYQFDHRFDIKNIGNEVFLSDVINCFENVDKIHASSVYYKWLEKERFLV